MSDVEKDTPSFEHTGDIKDVPKKDDVKTSKVIADEMDKINKEKTVDAVRVSMGEEPKKAEVVGTMTKDVPQLIFKLAAGFIDCKRFELDDSEAQTMVTHLNVLLPLSGKAASIVIILMITLNKVLMCIDSIRAKMGAAPAEAAGEKRTDLPEPLR